MAAAAGLPADSAAPRSCAVPRPDIAFLGRSAACQSCRTSMALAVGAPWNSLGVCPCTLRHVALIPMPLAVGISALFSGCHVAIPVLA